MSRNAALAGSTQPPVYYVRRFQRPQEQEGKTAVQALSGIDLHIEPGKFVSIIAAAKPSRAKRQPAHRPCGRPTCSRLTAPTKTSMSCLVLYGASEARTVASRPKRRKIGCAQ